MNIIHQHTSNRDTLRREVMAGLVVALTLIPESVAFSMVVGVSPVKSLVTTCVMLFIPALVGGRPGMISGAAGAIAVVTQSLVKSHGQQFLFAAVLLCGLLQILLSLSGVDRYFRMLPVSVVKGFMCGLAIIILKSQLHYFQDLDDGQFVEMSALVIFSLVVIHVSPTVVRKVPSSLVAVVVLSLTTKALGLKTKIIADVAGDLSELPSIQIPDLEWSWDNLMVVLPYSCIMCCIGVTETVLTLQVVDDKTFTKGSMRKEVFGQGLANALGGLLLNSQGGCAMIVPSNLNVASGGRRSISVITCGLFIVFFISFGSAYIGSIPVAVLVAILINMCVHTFDWEQCKALTRVPRVDALSTICVTVFTLVFNLAVGAMSGLLISALGYAYSRSNNMQVKRDATHKQLTYKVRGDLYWASATEFLNAFQVSKDSFEANLAIQIDMSDCSVVDQTGVLALKKLADNYRARNASIQFLGFTANSKALMQVQQGMDALVEV